jgi:hypothetical protein
MKANMHLHSLYSDGTQWPAEIVGRAKNLGLECLALTDHDNMEGVPAFLEACHNNNIIGYAAVELDCISPEFGYDKELLAYFPDARTPTDYSHTLEFTIAHQRRRVKKIKHYLKKLQDLYPYPEITFENYLRFHLNSHPNAPPGAQFTYQKPHIYQFLRNFGLQEIYPEFNRLTFPRFKELLGSWDAELPNSDAFVPTVEELVRIITADHGKAVIPHLALYYGKTWTEVKAKEEHYDRFLKYCFDIGVWGVEQYYYKEYAADPSMIAKLNQFLLLKAEKIGFKFTVGSDCHGKGHLDSDTMEKYWGEFSGF